MALSVDATLLEIGVRLVHLSPLLARIAAISCAMVVGWLAHRTMTFAVRTPPTFAEFGRYAAVAWTTAAINYGTFAAIILLRPQTLPIVALLAASVVATAFAYVGMRYAAFRHMR